MKRVYVSSTYEDLVEYRRAVGDALRKAGIPATCMEDYVAKDKRLVPNCLDDVARCPIYVGIFAWRYGYVPKKDNPQKLSITELEYRKAQEAGNACLLFLIDENAPWPPPMMDVVTDRRGRGRQIAKLRAAVAEYSPSLVDSASDLATKVLAAVYQESFSLPVGESELFNQIGTIPDLGSSHLGDIKNKVLAARHEEFVSLNIGNGESWWSTRLHLVAALAIDYTSIKQIAFKAEGDRFVGMLSPSAIRSALAAEFPKIEIAYLSSRKAAPVADGDLTVEVGGLVDDFRARMVEMSEGVGEASIKENVTEERLGRWFGGRHAVDIVDVTGEPPTLSQYQIVKRAAPFVPLVKEGKLLRVVDRIALATNISRSVLQGGLG